MSETAQSFLLIAIAALSPFDEQGAGVSELAARVTPAQYGQALREALRLMPNEGHRGAPHRTGERFQYYPASCPGCARALIEALIPKVESAVVGLHEEREEKT